MKNNWNSHNRHKAFFEKNKKGKTRWFNHHM